MTQSYEETDASHVLTMEEITNLTEEGGKPADTLMNVVALIATRFCLGAGEAERGMEPDAGTRPGDEGDAGSVSRHRQGSALSI